MTYCSKKCWGNQQLERNHFLRSHLKFIFSHIRGNPLCPLHQSLFQLYNTTFEQHQIFFFGKDTLFFESSFSLNISKVLLLYFISPYLLQLLMVKSISYQHCQIIKSYQTRFAKKILRMLIAKLSQSSSFNWAELALISFSLHTPPPPQPHQDKQ